MSAFAELGTYLVHDVRFTGSVGWRVIGDLASTRRHRARARAHDGEGGGVDGGVCGSVVGEDINLDGGVFERCGHIIEER